MTCKDLQYELDSVIDGRAPVDALFHLAICAPCRRLVAQLKRFHKAAGAAPKPPAPFDLRSRIASSLNTSPLGERLGRAPLGTTGEDEHEIRFRH